MDTCNQWWNFSVRFVAEPRGFFRTYYMTVEELVHSLCQMFPIFEYAASELGVKMERLIPCYPSKLVHLSNLIECASLHEVLRVYRTEQKRLRRILISPDSEIRLLEPRSRTEIKIYSKEHRWISTFEGITDGGKCCFALCFTVEKSEDESLIRRLFARFPAFKSAGRY